ncbi:MAG: hypothetical protein IT565_14350 [Rhodospirillales bacterium]|nr:hypothetical protein [Rhodospirillales bacterium]
MQYLGEKKQLDADHAQNAVWSLTDKRPITYIYDNSTTEFVARQLGRVQPSYRIKSKVVESVPGRLADIGPAVEVEANFRYFLAKDAETLVVLLDHEGKQIKQISRKPEKMVAGEHRSGMKVQVWGLDKGHYTIRLQTTRGETLHDMPIEI